MKVNAHEQACRTFKMIKDVLQKKWRCAFLPFVFVCVSYILCSGMWNIDLKKKKSDQPTLFFFLCYANQTIFFRPNLEIKPVGSWTQYKCSRRSTCYTHGLCVAICARARVGLPLLVDKEKSHISHLFSNDQSIDIVCKSCSIDPLKPQPW